ncbi:MAG TPA: hypothetical protein VND45_13305 [Thermoanaerobaculia bacterium]|nr:hypothetical protein [Thermoanaerobaculia bacterium]
MKRLVAACLAALVVAFTPAFASRQIIGSEQDHSLAGDATDCEHFYKTTFTNLPSQMNDQEQREIPLAGVDRLRVVATEEGGVSIRGWNRPYARLIVCRYAVAANKSKAIRLLGAITIPPDNGEVAAYGPLNDATQVWWVNMILYVPRRATVDVRAASGGVAIRNMSGNVTAYATSGGISVAQSTGRYKISTNSGGITLERVSGIVEASSRQGAIALKLPPDELPFVEAKIAEAGEILCQLQGCEGGTWGANRRQLRLGHGAPSYRLSTNTAPILIGPVTF